MYSYDGRMRAVGLYYNAWKTHRCYPLSGGLPANHTARIIAPGVSNRRERKRSAMHRDALIRWNPL